MRGLDNPQTTPVNLGLDSVLIRATLALNQRSAELLSHQCRGQDFPTTASPSGDIKGVAVQSVVVRVHELIVKVEENRTAHQEKYAQAHREFRAELLKMIRERAEAIERGDEITNELLHLRLPQPKSHVEDYDRVLAMLRMHVEDTIELGEYDVQQYVMDDWGWKQEFTTTNSRYGVQ